MKDRSRAFEDGLLSAYMDSAQPSQLMADIATKKALDDDLKKRLTDAIKDFKGSFLAGLKDKAKASCQRDQRELKTTPATAMVGNN